MHVQQCVCLVHRYVYVVLCMHVCVCVIMCMRKCMAVSICHVEMRVSTCLCVVYVYVLMRGAYIRERVHDYIDMSMYTSLRCAYSVINFIRIMNIDDDLITLLSLLYASDVCARPCCKCLHV